MLHHPTHWIAVALVSALALVAFEASGQGTGSPNLFDGRPALAGANGGLGAQAGLPQGGIGLQGSEGAQRNLRRPHVIAQAMEAPPAAGCEGPPEILADAKRLCLPQAREERLARRLAILGIDTEQD